VVGQPQVDGQPGRLGPQVVAVDGKTLRRSHDQGAGKAALHLVSAWATESGLVVGRVATDTKSNEITAIPTLLKLLAREGTTVAIDVMGCQTAIAARIVEQGADYVLALKDNRPPLHERVRLAFADADAAVGTTFPLADPEAHTAVEKGHGRIERRGCRAIGDSDHA
jgi:predicted transposase YbfD/YdcC